MRKWGVHVCVLDKTCRECWAMEFAGERKRWWDKIPSRVHVSTPWVHVGVALLRGDWFYSGLVAGHSRPWTVQRPTGRGRHTGGS